MPMRIDPTYSYSLRYVSVNTPGDSENFYAEPDNEPTDDMVSFTEGFLDEYGERSLMPEWQQMDEQMLRLSLAYPTLLFAVYVKGWIDHDHFAAYYLNGKKQEKMGFIEYQVPVPGSWQ
jgi:hypothetical protein